MLIRIINRTNYELSLPGPLPRLTRDADVTTEIIPDDYDRLKDELGVLVNHNLIRVFVEISGSMSGNFLLDDFTGSILYKNTQIAPVPVSDSDKVRITSADLTPSFLDDAIVSGTGLVKTILNPGGDEQYQLDVSDAPPSGPASGDLSGNYPSPKVQRLTITVRNETGSPLLKGKLVSAIGTKSGGITLVTLADKDDPNRRPAIAILEADLPDNTTTDALVYGVLEGIDTSIYSVTDQLLLGNNGDLTRPPPDVDPYSGEVQYIASVIYDDPSDGEIAVSISQILDTLTGAHAFFVREQSGTGWVNGGEVSRRGGLSLSVTAGKGYVNSGTDITRVTWSADFINAPANQLSDVYVDIDGNILVDANPVNLNNSIILATVYTDTTNVLVLSGRTVDVKQVYSRAHDYIVNVIGPIVRSGCSIIENSPPSLQFDVEAGTYYIDMDLRSATTVSPATFNYWYRNGSGKWTVLLSQTAIDDNYYDDGTGTLAAIPAGEFKKDAVYISVTDGKTDVHVIYAQETYTTQAEAEAGNFPSVADSLSNFALRCAGIVVEQHGGDILVIQDARPLLGQLAPSSSVTTDHGLLSGLNDPTDHTWAERISNKNAPNGYAGLSALSKLNGAQQVYGTVINTACQGNDARLSDARVPLPHAASHQNSGTDEIATATPAANAIPKADGSGRLNDWVDHLPVSFEASATGVATTASPTDVLMAGMTITPGAGTYLVNFSTTISCSTNGGMSISVYAAGSQITHSLRGRSFSGVGLTIYVPISTNCKVTVNDGEAIEIRWNVVSGTGTAIQRTLNLIKVL